MLRCSCTGSAFFLSTAKNLLVTEMCNVIAVENTCKCLAAFFFSRGEEILIKQ